jgi:hypothetical protein
LRWLKSDSEFRSPPPRGNTDQAGKLALAQSAEGIFGRCWQIALEAGAEAMSPYVLDVVLQIFGIRGHVPRDGDLPARPNRPPLATNAGTLMRVLAASVLTIAFLSVVLWLAVRLLSLKLL